MRKGKSENISNWLESHSYSLSILLAAKWRAHFDSSIAIGRGDIELLDVRDDERRHAQHYGKYPDDYGREDGQRFSLFRRREEIRCLNDAATLCTHLQLAQRIDNGAVTLSRERSQREDGYANWDVLKEFRNATHVALKGPTVLRVNNGGNGHADQDYQQIGQGQWENVTIGMGENRKTVDNIYIY